MSSAGHMLFVLPQHDTTSQIADSIRGEYLIESASECRNDTYVQPNRAGGGQCRLLEQSIFLVDRDDEWAGQI